MITEIIVGDKVRHKTKFINGNAPMIVSKLQDNQALCEHFEPNEEGGSTQKQSYFPVEELEKVIYG